MNIIEKLKDRIQGKAPKGAKRSSNWSKVRKQVLQDNKKCAICGATFKLRVHHLIPFHLAPDLELELDNLTVLCENKKYGINCHLLCGHLGNFRRTNPNCEIDIMVWHKKLLN